mmetsp:Transcript_51061/g.123201  ORF Transcript_51061/g.123201 Transcript_51061/m.123201 type:complete len:431 (+) Transcript_51061:617-1909(+)
MMDSSYSSSQLMKRKRQSPSEQHHGRGEEEGGSERNHQHQHLHSQEEEEEDWMDYDDNDEHVNNTIIEEEVVIEKLKPEAIACSRRTSNGCTTTRRIRSSSRRRGSGRMELLNWHSRQESSGEYDNVDDEEDIGYVADGDVSSSTSSSSSSSSTVTSTSSPFSSPTYSPMDDDDDEEEEEEDDRKPTAAIVASFSSSSPFTLSRKAVAATHVKTPTLLDVGADVIANVLSFVGPAEALRLLTVPLCTQWRTSYTANQDLWRTLCKSEPFSATLEDGHQGSRSKKNENKERDYDDDSTSDDDDDDSFCSLDKYSDSDDDGDSESHDVLGEYRLMYTSFVRCMNYLNRIHDDAKKGRPLSGGSYNINSTFPTFGVTKGLKKFLSRSKNHEALKAVIGGSNGPSSHPSSPIGVSADGREVMVSALTTSCQLDL